MTETPQTLTDLLPTLVDTLAACRRCPVGPNTQHRTCLSGQLAIHQVLENLLAVLFPGCHRHEPVHEETMAAELDRLLTSIQQELKRHIQRALEYECKRIKCEDCHRCGERAETISISFLAALPAIKMMLQDDIVAAYEGDPAAKSTMEVVMSYPGVYAVIVHRLAHELYRQQVPLIPRMMSERAHTLTGIDIHPGATIGPGFFIDHGTGVVIGETCNIGHHVKLYQGVTLGALSFEKDADGRLVKGIKRHPDVEDHVVIYSGATILGGSTVIGAGSEIGGNVWLTHSVPPGSKVYNQQPRPLIRQADGKWKKVDGPWDDLGAGI